MALVFVLAVLAAALSLGRSGEGVAEKQPERGEEGGVGEVEVGVGESAEITKGVYEGSIVTFNDLQRNFAFPNDDPQPRAGYEFVLVNLTVTNPSPEPQLLMPTQYFEIMPTRPYRDNYPVRGMYRAKTPEGLPNAISPSWMEPYEEVTGVLYGEVPKDAPVITLLYSPPLDYIVDYDKPPQSH